MGRKILLTGGSGFIGRNICESELAVKNEIIAPSSSEFNLLDTENVDAFFAKHTFDVVLHAGTKPGHRNTKDPRNLFYANMRMFENLARHKAKFGKLINFGSGAIYDTGRDITNAQETDIFKNMPKDDHGFCKYVAAQRIAVLDNFVDLNIFGVFGKYEDWEIRFISNAICKAVCGLPITLRQNRRFSYLYINDLMPVLDFFLKNETKHRSYNIVPDAKVELIEIAEMVKRISGGDAEIQVAVAGRGLDYTGDNSRLKNEIKAVQFLPLEHAVMELWQYYESNKFIIDAKKLLINK